jgi:hypothetical protein
VVAPAAHLRVGRLHQQASDAAAAQLGQDIEAIDVTDPAGRPHEVRLVVEPDHVADKPSLFFCEEALAGSSAPIQLGQLF